MEEKERIHSLLSSFFSSPLGILYLPTCVGFGYRYPFVEGRSSFSWEYGMEPSIKERDAKQIHFASSLLRVVPTKNRTNDVALIC
jgi:hypothetical protein